MLQYLEQKSEMVNEQIEKFLPKKIDDEWIKQHIGRTKLSKELCNELIKPIHDILSRDSKRWRPVLMLLCCDAVDGGSKIMDFIPLVELIHKGTLVIDDIDNGSLLKKKTPAIHKRYGADVAVNTGNLLYYLPHLIIKNSDIDKRLKLKIHEVVAEEMFRLHIGQGMNIYWHNNNVEISEESYLQMCAFRTGVLARMAARIGSLFGNATTGQINTLGRFAETIGIAFQIQDDILNISGNQVDDITRGKRSLMVIHVLEDGRLSDKKRLLEILAMKTDDAGLKLEAINIMKKYKAIDYARSKVRKIVITARNQLDSAIRDSSSKSKLMKLAEVLIEEI